jgi:hypothetical protein
MTKLCELLWLIVNCSLVILSFLSGFYRIGEVRSPSWPLTIVIAMIVPALILAVYWFTGRPAQAPSLTGSVFAHSGFFQLTFIASMANIAFGLGEYLRGVPKIYFSPNTAKIFVAGAIMLGECIVFTRFEIGVRKRDSRGDSLTT